MNRRNLGSLVLLVLVAPASAQLPQVGDILLNRFSYSGGVDAVLHYQPDGTELTMASGGRGGDYEGACLSAGELLLTSRRSPNGFNLFDPITGLQVASYDAPQMGHVPADTAVFSDGTLAIGDQSGSVHLYTKAGVHVSSIAVTGIAQLFCLYIDRNDELWVGDRNASQSAIYHFNQAGTLLGSFSTTFGVGDIVMASDGTLWAAGRDNSTVHHLDTTGASLGSFATLVSPGGFSGLGIAADDSLYVTSRDSTNLYHYDTAGVLLGQFAVTTDVGTTWLFITVVGASAGIGDPFCAALVNSTGGAAHISAVGSDSIAAKDLTLRSSPVPDQPGIFFYGPTQVQLPFGNGYLCVSGALSLLWPVGVAVGGAAQYSLDFVAQGIIPGILNFQYWYRDPAAGGAYFNTSNGLAILFTP